MISKSSVEWMIIPWLVSKQNIGGDSIQIEIVIFTHEMAKTEPNFHEGVILVTWKYCKCTNQ
ncbi:hypothetical protein LguiA_024854 [Lonicera macranthoides]